jgi:His-Xaa-Ser system protein HxsD
MENAILSGQAADTTVTVRADPKIFSETAVLRAAHRLTDHCYVSLHREGEWFSVKLQPIGGPVEPAAIEGRFANLLLDEELRARVAGETEAERRLIIAYALSKQTVVAARGDDSPSKGSER